jgi:zinc ribbon protein
VAEAESEPVAAEAEPEPVAAAEAEPEPVAAEAEPEPIRAPAAPEPAQELPVAAASTPQAPIEPIPTAIGKPLPASVVDGPLAWPVPDIAAAAFEQQWPDIPAPRVPTPSAPTPAAPVQPPPAPVQQAQQPPIGGVLRRTGANLPSVTAPPPILAARACPSCGLSLSASARFCRRCGTPQQADAVR